MSESREATLEAKVDALTKKVRHLEERIEELESSGSAAGVTSDRRDAAVLDALDPGQTISRGQLVGLYRQTTDIQSESTAISRVKSLVNRDVFEQVSFGKWRYVGGDTDE